MIKVFHSHLTLAVMWLCCGSPLKECGADRPPKPCTLWGPLYLLTEQVFSMTKTFKFQDKDGTWVSVCVPMVTD